MHCLERGLSERCSNVVLLKGACSGTEGVNILGCTNAGHVGDGTGQKAWFEEVGFKYAYFEPFS